MNISMNQVLIILGGLVLLYLLREYAYNPYMISAFTNGSGAPAAGKKVPANTKKCKSDTDCTDASCKDGYCVKEDGSYETMAAASAEGFRGSRSGFTGSGPVGYSADTASNLRPVNEIGDPNGAGYPGGNCYPKAQLNPSELLPSDPHSGWAQLNPQGAGDLAGKNLIDPSYFLGVNTVGQSLRNANQQLRSDPPIPSGPSFGILQSTIQPDVYRKSFEIGGM